jgi:hypothetical protein
MRTLILAAGFAVLPFATAIVAAAPAQAAQVHRTLSCPSRGCAQPRRPVGSSWVEGTLVRISTSNIKVRDDKTGREMSFLLVPHFDQVFSADGKTTYQMKALHSGQFVKVFYDRKALFTRHADRILVLSRK